MYRLPEGLEVQGTSQPEKLVKRARNLRVFGALLYGLGILVGGALLVLLFVFFPAAVGEFGLLKSMLLGAVLALPASLVYLTFPRLLDRYDPEPAYALALAWLWGGVAACGISAIINTMVGVVVSSAINPEVGEAVSAVVSAPIVEEATKGVFVLGLFVFLRREFDGMVDGIIYGTFVAIGFAAVENIIYYGRAGFEAGAGGLMATFVIRGILAPWGHPLYTAMTGLGIGLARESASLPVRILAPLFGYGTAVFLHAAWNGIATFFGGAIFCTLPLWFLFVFAFVIIVVVLVHRRGKLIRNHLVDEVALGHLSKAELTLATSAFGGLTARFRAGRQGAEFVRSVARLGLSKWHSARAVKNSKQTMSMDFIVPLRQKIKTLRQQCEGKLAP